MNEVERYFKAERAECLLGIFISLISLSLSAAFIGMEKQPFYTGTAIIFLIAALVEFAICYTVFVRSPKDIVRVNGFLLNDKSKIQSEEIPRMEKVLRNFIVYRWGEMVLALIGLAVLFIFPYATVWKGIGAALFIHAGILLVFDFFAEERGKKYLKFLRELKA